MTPNLLDELEWIVALSKKATPGPWERGSGARNEPATMVYCDDALGSAVANCHLEYTVAISGDRELGNAALIAASVNFLRTHAPALADMAKRLEAAERECEEQARLNGMGAERELALRAKLEAAERDSKRLDWLEGQREAYGFENYHEGNRWVIDGPFATVRQAIDATQEGEG